MDIYVHHNNTGDSIVLSFNTLYAYDLFQFGRTLKNLNIPHLIMRDTRKQYYQQGITEFPSRELLVNFIRSLKNNFHVTTMGVSSGSYAALLYGQLAEVNRIIAISPHTGINVEDFPPRFHHIFGSDPSLAFGRNEFPFVDDLQQFFKNGPIPEVKAFVGTGISDHHFDIHMAERLGITDITLVPGFSHSTLARGMRDNGMLKDLLNGQSV